MLFKRLAIIFLSILTIVFILVACINYLLVKDDLANCQTVGSGACMKADVIVAVSGGNTPTRTDKAISLYKAGFADKIIFSGDSADPSAKSNAKTMMEQAIINNIPIDNILLDETSRNTKENAKNSLAIIHKLKASRVILVSSPYHLRRVLANFSLLDNKVNYRTASASDPAWSLWFINPFGWYITITELVGLAELSIRGRP